MYGFSFYKGKKFEKLEDKFDRDIISVENFKKFIMKLQQDATAPNASWKLFETFVYIFMMYSTGIRTSDALAMTFDNIRFESKQTKFSFTQQKTNENQKIIGSEYLGDLLKKIRDKKIKDELEKGTGLNI